MTSPAACSDASSRDSRMGKAMSSLSFVCPNGGFHAVSWNIQAHCCTLQRLSPPRPACHAAQSSHLLHPVAAPPHKSDLQCCISEIVGLMRPEGAPMTPWRVNIITCHIQPPVDPPLTIPPSAGATFEPQPISRCTRDPSIPKHAVVLPCTQE